MIFVINFVEMLTQLLEASCLYVWGELSRVVPSCLKFGASLLGCNGATCPFLDQTGFINYSNLPM